MILAAEALTVRAGGRALLDRVSLGVAPGEVLALVGPNGAGKSTLLRALAGELRPAGGEVALAGKALREWSPLALAQRRAVVSQRVALGFPMTVAAVVALGRLPWHATPGAKQDAAAVVAAMRTAGVAHLAQRQYGTLSGGEKQRVQVARALAQLDGAPSPAVLLLDEPTASLDVAHGAALLHTARRLAGAGTAVVIVLHDLNEAAFVADRVAVLAAGRLVGLGVPREVLAPATLAAVYGLPFRVVAGGGVLPVFDGMAAAGARRCSQ